MFDFDGQRRQESMLLDLFQDLLTRAKELQTRSVSMGQHYSEVVSTNAILTSQNEYFKAEFGTLEERLKNASRELERSETELLDTRGQLQDALAEISSVRDKLLKESTDSKAA